MAAAKQSLKVEYGADWLYCATIELNLAGATCEVEILKEKDDISECRLAYLSSGVVIKDGDIRITPVSGTQSQIDFLLDSDVLIHKVGAGNFYWRLYVTDSTGFKDKIIFGAFKYRD